MTTDRAQRPVPRVGSLCSGYGGLDLGLITALGGEVVWHAELDPDACRVLDARFPGTPNYGDITTADWSVAEPIDWATAGYPCQPESLAGKGLSEDDPRWIWPAIVRAVGDLRPRHLLLENVAGHLVRGFRTVVGSLAGIGYDARWTLVPAARVGAPHLRKRLFVVATDTARHGRHEGRSEPAGQLRRLDAAECGPVAPDTRRARLGQRSADTPTQETWTLTGHQPASDRGSRTATDWGPYRPAVERWERVTGRQAPRPTAITGRGERLNPVFVEWLMGLPAGWVTDIPMARNAHLRLLGNGVVPQQAALAVSVLHHNEAVAA